MESIDIDSFAGGGGASLGIEWGLGRSPAVAINHDADAIAMHAANHPETEHHITNIWRIDPADAVRGRPVRLAWFSPDCKHFSKAKGGKPVEKRIRDLAWVVVLWAKRARPDVIMLENVEEFADWGPLLDSGMPCPDRRGFTFRRWLGELKRLGYKVEHRELRGCDYGAPTIRKRLFLIARRDGKPIVWPEPTHGPGRLPYRTAAECIDWSLPCPSIFLTREQGRAIGVIRPLAEATMARIAKGIQRYVIDAAEPFIVNLTHGARTEPTREPFKTITGAHRGEKAIVAPYLVPRYGERPGQDPRTHSIEQPLPTVVPTRNGGALVAAFMAQHNSERRGAKAGRAAREPLATITGTGRQQSLVTAFLAQHNTGMVGHPPTKPVSTIVGKGCTQAVVAANILSLKGSDRRMADARAPMPTVTAGGWHLAEVRTFLRKHLGGADPVVTIGSERFEIVDIGMRMLTPRELFRAQGFPDSYIIDPSIDGKPIGKTAQIRMCGNSVCPPVVAALTRANFPQAEQRTEAA